MKSKTRSSMRRVKECALVSRRWPHPPLVAHHRAVINEEEEQNSEQYAVDAEAECAADGAAARVGRTTAAVARAREARPLATGTGTLRCTPLLLFLGVERSSLVVVLIVTVARGAVPEQGHCTRLALLCRSQSRCGRGLRRLVSCATQLRLLVLLRRRGHQSGMPMDVPVARLVAS